MFESKVSRDELERVWSCVGDSTSAERNAVVKALRKGDGADFGPALVSCVGMTMVGDTHALRLAGVVDTLSTHLKRGDKPHIFLIALALGSLANNEENRVAIAREGVIAPLIQLLQRGPIVQVVAVYHALVALSFDNEANKAAIVDGGGPISHLEQLLPLGLIHLKKAAAYALEKLACSDVNTNAVA